jgi:gamma-glutamyltranspeptidase/glutathione hydrolase
MKHGRDKKTNVEINNQVDPISLKFRGQGVGKIQSENSDGPQESSFENDGIEVWEHPPNGQGIVALIALGILEELEKTGKIPIFKETEHNTAPYLHAVVEALRIAFADASWWVTDPSKSCLIPLKIMAKLIAGSHRCCRRPNKGTYLAALPCRTS